MSGAGPEGQPPQQPQSAAERQRRSRAARAARRPTPLGGIPPEGQPPQQPQSAAERQRRSRAARAARHPPPGEIPPEGQPPQQPQSAAERQRRSRAARAARRPETEGDIPERDPDFLRYWEAASRKLDSLFYNNPFGHSCTVCDRLWFKQDLKNVSPRDYSVLEVAFGPMPPTFVACENCRRALKRRQMPTQSISNGFVYPPKPSLPALDPIVVRLISPRIPFMSIRRLQREGYCIIGQVINIPINVDALVQQLPRQLDDDQAFNVAIKRKLIHKSNYLTGQVRKRVVKEWLRYLINQPLYRHYNITIGHQFLQQDFEEPDHYPDSELIEEFEANHDSDYLNARQHTMFWDESHVLNLAPGERMRPINITYDTYAEELSFPQIFYGVGRFFSPGVKVTPYLIANSEIRRKDRRGVTPEHILYMAMKILRLRAVDGIRRSFRNVLETENITRRMIENQDFLDECLRKDFSFLDSVPNSVQYWASRKKDLFALMRQLGKPTMFLTMSANELNWPHLITLLHDLNDYHKDIVVRDPLIDLSRSIRAHLVNEDPVTCCIYFDKLVEVVMRLLTTKRNWNPFGKYRVIDYFMRIEFQHRGSPHAHILLWLDNDPKEIISESMPATLKLITDLCSVSREDVPECQYGNQIHRHTFTCTKRGETSCRFNIPYWPMRKSRILLPIQNDDSLVRSLRTKSKAIMAKLEIKNYGSIDEFLLDNGLNDETYVDVIRSTIAKPTLIFKREMSEIMVNTFNPWISKILNSNMDLQFILDEYSCAAYVAEYINKSNRGAGNLHRELIKLHEQKPEMTHEQLLKHIGTKILNSIELSAQEGAWFLLRQPMSKCSRDVIFIPTSKPEGRSKARKSQAQLDAERIGPDSMDIWTKNIIQHYEDRPSEMENICLADFAAWYTKRPVARAPPPTDQDEEQDSDEDGLVEELGNPNQAEREEPQQGPNFGPYRRREFSRVIRYINYDQADINNYKREMVTLFVPFRNEMIDVIDRNKFLSIYDENIHVIAEKSAEYNSGCNITQILEEVERLRGQSNDEDESHERRERFAAELQEEDFDDLTRGPAANVSSRVSTRTNILSKEEYCRLIRSTNPRQREIILEVIHRLCLPSDQHRPLQIFFTGPAGCGKTYTLKAIMETYNRFSQSQDILSNSYIACASTGKAAVNLGGVTVHSAFSITPSANQGRISARNLRSFQDKFANVKVIIVDEVSMIGNDILHRIDLRLREITGQEEAFGGMNIIFCGDFKQLPPVNATPVYRGSRNHLEGAVLWQSLDYFPLTQVMRQSDERFSRILTKIGEGEALTTDESTIIEQRFRTVAWCDEHLRGVVRLFHRNAAVDDFNRRSIQNGREYLPHDTFVGYSSDEDLSRARTKLHKMSTMETGGLPYILILAIGYPYMIMTNIDVEDGLVNGSVGLLRFVEDLPEQDSSHPLGSLVRVWIEFSESLVGTKARLKFRSAALRRQGQIADTWTPIKAQSGTIDLGRTIKCKRSQLPIVPACAITIHKSQGGTFDNVVLEYDKSLQNQMVYVGMSRVTTIDGLFLINWQNDHIFYHKYGSTAESIRQIRDEYSRLSLHPLPTLTEEVRRFMNSDGETRSMVICTINAQSLMAHFEDISTDTILVESDILAVTETWMNNTDIIRLTGYNMIANSCRSIDQPIAGTSRDQNQPGRRNAGGVAIYKSSRSPAICTPVNFTMANGRRILDNSNGDFSLVEVENGDTRFILGVFYVHPNISKTNLRLFIYYTLSPYTEATRRLEPDAEVDVTTPLLITGDFNSDVSRDDWLVRFMADEFHLTYVPCRSPTTLGNSIIDLTFVRNLQVENLPFVSYFSYHRPLLNKLTV